MRKNKKKSTYKEYNNNLYNANREDNEGIFFNEEDIYDDDYTPEYCHHIYIDLANGRY